MSGQNEVGRQTAVGPDVQALMAANPQDAGQTGEYQVAAGGFERPGQAEEVTPPSEPNPAEVQEQLQQQQEGETILGAPKEETTAEPAPQPEPEPEPEPTGPDYDSIINGLTGAAEAERKARQQIQESLKETEMKLREAEAFRQQYGPHIDELSELWPQIRQREMALEQAQQQQALLDQKLKAYRDAMAEAGVQVDESSIDSQYMQQRMLQALENLPNTIDQRLAHALDSRTAQYSQSEAQRAAEQAQRDAEKARLEAAASVLDQFYKDNEGMEEYDRFIRPQIESDPTTDPRTIAAPFLRHEASQAARRRAEAASAVQVQPGSETGQASATQQQAASSDDLAAQFANMSLDDQFAKARRMGLLR